MDRGGRLPRIPRRRANYDLLVDALGDFAKLRPVAFGVMVTA